jgi:nucleotide-binding universal stress UspA family protein
VRPAPPAQVIADVARERNADLIEMASHQRHGLNRWVNGSVTEEVLARTSTPLLVVPAAAKEPRTSTVCVLVPTDGTTVGEAPITFLVTQPRTRPLDVLLLSVISAGPLVVGTDPSFVAQPLGEAELEAHSRESAGYLLAVAESITTGCMSARWQVVETSEPLANVILNAARHEHVDLIALGTHAKDGVRRLVLGSVSGEVLERSPVPVLLVHDHATRAHAETEQYCMGSDAGAKRR